MVYEKGNVVQANNDESKKNKQREDRRRFRGFASMPRSRVIEIAKLGGKVRAKQLGHDGYVELGKLGGKARSTQLTHDDYVAMGRKGGLGNARRIKKQKSLMSEMKYAPL